ncbi:hypothetical protein [Paracoccus laeviglucosivorans]|uniref:Uncharacterized protein n=1 Tax=Paracoccus laeviglucosivorans TaxID=1197861 RepID=A0A521FSQ7_9RHOB|nr:hypothetical protein [Paracoccus laeviglucosivorans]SMO98560.1 hypothetical protein SAMN06265221_1355 [Paracoccus laeviglucosivorans]
MKPATLTLTAQDPIRGHTESGGDYALFRTAANVSLEQTEGPHEGEIEIDGRRERVVLEGAHPTQSSPGMQTDDTFDITLRRISPAGS